MHNVIIDIRVSDPAASLSHVGTRCWLPYGQETEPRSTKPKPPLPMVVKRKVRVDSDCLHSTSVPLCCFEAAAVTYGDQHIAC